MQAWLKKDKIIPLPFNKFQLAIKTNDGLSMYMVSIMPLKLT